MNIEAANNLAIKAIQLKEYMADSLDNNPEFNQIAVTAVLLTSYRKGLLQGEREVLKTIPSNQNILEYIPSEWSQEKVQGFTEGVEYIINNLTKT